jgi:hypothetical protein
VVYVSVELAAVKKFVVVRLVVTEMMSVGGVAVVFGVTKFVSVAVAVLVV